MRIKRLFRGIIVIMFTVILPVQSIARGHYENSDVEVNIVADQRGILRKFDARSKRADVERSFVIARNDERYRIQVRNISNKRIGVVIAVDGRNIISGKKSYLTFRERMYVLHPYQTQEFEGWRTGRNRTHRFYFTGMSDSYAANWGDTTAMGVIAVAVFRERRQQISRKGLGKGRDKQRLGESRSMREAPGTGFGENEWSPSREVIFFAHNRPIEKKFIKYEWHSTLCRLAVIRCRSDYKQNRFWPAPNRDEGYAPFPQRFYDVWHP